ncbi:cytochrome P450 [Hyphomonas pacifica]|uniref:Cytochrome P450 n=1 Tax=Hyphomonas pacifica TaxID=1280941 RepID=A0A062U986_9PROT|nr:cytochrome P450 [Hyphomonas pacifica]KCZ52685.1 cytochrome P450 [Hyphomonas pacifica]RAN34049.1 cytochrome P450 [Hyphomonas pacifica]
MSLQNVTDTYQQEVPPAPPKRKPVHDLPPPVNLTDPEVFSRHGGYTHEAFAQMRQQAPVMWHPEEVAAGFWAVTSYDLVKQVELDPATYSSQRGGILMTYGLPEQPKHPLLHSSSLNSLINLDRPYHTPLRMEHMHFFRPGFVAELRKRVEVYVTELLDAMEKQGPVVDMVEKFSAELPLFTLCEILGVPAEDRPKLVHWMHFLETSQYQAQQEGLGNVSQEQIMTFMTEIQAMFEYGRHMLAKRRENPQEDLLSAIANVEIDGKPLSPEFLDGSWLLIVFAGNDTTRNSLSGTMRLLTEFPDQKEKLLANPDLFPNFVHESIRMVSPVTYMRRTATTDTQLGDQPIAEGDKVVMYYAAANRDPAKFADPHRYDITRENAKEHLAFGHGPHVCLGQRVANMQLETAYRQILSRFPNIRWTGEQSLAPNNFVHAISSLMVDLGS